MGRVCSLTPDRGLSELASCMVFNDGDGSSIRVHVTMVPVHSYRPRI